MLDAIVENLHHRRSPVVQCRSVNLSDGPGRHRIRVERAVKIRHGTTELAFNQPLCHTRRIRCDRRLRFDQLPGDVVADDIRPQAQHLTELDPRGAQLGQRPPQPLTVRHRDDLGIDVSVDEPLMKGALISPLPRCTHATKPYFVNTAPISLSRSRWRTKAAGIPGMTHSSGGQPLAPRSACSPACTDTKPRASVLRGEPLEQVYRELLATRPAPPRADRG